MTLTIKTGAARLELTLPANNNTTEDRRDGHNTTDNTQDKENNTD
jgi:hypothetical protein